MKMSRLSNKRKTSWVDDEDDDDDDDDLSRSLSIRWYGAKSFPTILQRAIPGDPKPKGLNS